MNNYIFFLYWKQRLYSSLSQILSQKQTISKQLNGRKIYNFNSFLLEFICRHQRKTPILFFYLITYSVLDYVACWALNVVRCLIAKKHLQLGNSAGLIIDRSPRATFINIILTLILISFDKLSNKLIINIFYYSYFSC